MALVLPKMISHSEAPDMAPTGKSAWSRHRVGEKKIWEKQKLTGGAAWFMAAKFGCQTAASYKKSQLQPNTLAKAQCPEHQWCGGLDPSIENITQSITLIIVHQNFTSLNIVEVR